MGACAPALLCVPLRVRVRVRVRLCVCVCVRVRARAQSAKILRFCRDSGPEWHDDMAILSRCGDGYPNQMQ